jgi:2-C-methyl-D-erythritol 4-phosphate cytidylyltransferase
MNSAVPKQYLELAGKPVICHVLEAFDSHPRIAGTVIALAASDARWAAAATRVNKPLHRVTGGATRMQSVISGLEFLNGHAAPEDWVMVHDAARPCLTHGDLDRMIDALYTHVVGGLLGVRIADTVKRVDTAGNVTETIDRSQLWRAFTPQMFRLKLLYGALTDAAAHGRDVTDEAAAMERMGYTPVMVEGRPDNIKITHAHDVALAEFYLNHR